jgi:hypothetical protein
LPGNFKMSKQYTVFKTALPSLLLQAVKFVDELMAIKTDKLGPDTLLAVAKTSMGSKIVGSEGNFFAKMVVEAILAVKTTDQVGLAWWWWWWGGGAGAQGGGEFGWGGGGHPAVKTTDQVAWLDRVGGGMVGAQA